MSANNSHFLLFNPFPIRSENTGEPEDNTFHLLDEFAQPVDGSVGTVVDLTIVSLGPIMVQSWF